MQSSLRLGCERGLLHGAKPWALGSAIRGVPEYLDALEDVSGFRVRSFVVSGEGAEGWVASVSDGDDWKRTDYRV